MLDEVAEICQAKREGRLIVLPCKVGDTVYRIHHEFVAAFTPSFHVYEILECTFTLDMFEEIGETVFLTREEAEKALAERRGKQLKK